MRLATGGGGAGGAGGGAGGATKYKIAEAEIDPHALQDLGDMIPRILDIKAKANIPVRFVLRVEVGDGESPPPDSVTEELNAVLKDISEELGLQ